MLFFSRASFQEASFCYYLHFQFLSYTQFIPGDVTVGILAESNVESNVEIQAPASILYQLRKLATIATLLPTKKTCQLGWKTHVIEKSSDDKLFSRSRCEERGWYSGDANKILPVDCGLVVLGQLLEILLRVLEKGIDPHSMVMKGHEIMGETIKNGDRLGWNGGTQSSCQYPVQLGSKYEISDIPTDRSEMPKKT